MPLIFISGTKDGFEEMEYDFHSMDIFRLHKQDYLFRNALALGKFSTGMTQKAMFLLLSKQIFKKAFGKW